MAKAICDALKDPDAPLRLPVGSDAQLVTAARGSTPYGEFEAAMRAVLKVDW